MNWSCQRCFLSGRLHTVWAKAEMQWSHLGRCWGLVDHGTGWTSWAISCRRSKQGRVSDGDNSTDFTPGAGSAVAVVPLGGVKSGMCKLQPWNIVLASLVVCFHGWGKDKCAVPSVAPCVLSLFPVIKYCSRRHWLGWENHTKIMTLLPPTQTPPSLSFFSSLFVSCFWVKRIF